MYGLDSLGKTVYMILKEYGVKKDYFITPVNKKKDILRIVNSDSMGINIKIGQENELKVMKNCSVITVPYETSSGGVGALTLFGPTRMEYDKVIPLLEHIAKNMKKIV